MAKAACQAAFITGAAGGIGMGALAVALASRGVQVTILDLKVAQGEETVRLVEEQHEKIFYKPRSPSAIFIRCNVTKSDELAAAFSRHQEMFGRLDVCINNAGIGEGKPFFNSEDWRRVIDFNLVALIDGTAKAIQAMKEKGGFILILGYGASLGPVPYMPVYAATKGWWVVRVCYTVRGNTAHLMDSPRDNLGFVKMERVLAAAFYLLDDESMSGECIRIPVNKPTQIWPYVETKAKYTTLFKGGTVFTGAFE
uniref:Uncharacterized protein n=2 Tax=Physcomitrium patens TaxID=3218 RepID=A0A7I4A2S0_PHYPA